MTSSWLVAYDSILCSTFSAICLRTRNTRIGFSQTECAGAEQGGAGNFTLVGTHYLLLTKSLEYMML